MKKTITLIAVFAVGFVVGKLTNPPCANCEQLAAADSILNSDYIDGVIEELRDLQDDVRLIRRVEYHLGDLRPSFMLIEAKLDACEILLAQIVRESDNRRDRD